MSSPVPWTPHHALAYLKWLSTHRDKDYTSLCAHVAARAAGYDGAGLPSASAWGRTVPEHLREYTEPPRGTLVFWITSGWGHVAWSLGGGRVICNMDHQGHVGPQSMAYYRGLGRPFWVKPYPGLFVHAFGRNPYPGPDSLAGTATAPARVLKAGDHGPQVKALKIKLMGYSPKRTDLFSERTVAVVKEWQARHGHKVTGVITAGEYHAITGKTL